MFGLVEIEAPPGFTPKTSDTVPSGALGGIPSDLLCEFAAMFNASLYAVQKRRWAAVALNGALIFIHDIAREVRPHDPRAFPPGTIGGLTFEAANDAQILSNAERVKLARTPRQWTIALRPLTPLFPTPNNRATVPPCCATSAA